MADDVALHHVNDILGDIGRHVGDPLDVLGYRVDSQQSFGVVWVGLDPRHHPPLDSLAAVISRVVCGVEGASNLHDEAYWAKIITGLLHEVDPNVDPTHLSHLPATNGAEAEAEVDQEGKENG